ncbi:hypothetical protein DFH06DRAFT_1266823 [Mycena polygramma]|nr:hypothetical protein DFH06DRAFT_1266823 [Mycena polygramma]
MPDATDPTLLLPSREARKAAEDRFYRKPIVVKYPSDVAGQPLRSTPSKTSEEAYKSSLDTPFKSKMDWEGGKWAKLRGSGSTAFTDLLQVDGHSTSAELNKIIDDKLPGRPRFSRSEVVVNGEVFYLYSRNVLECVRALWGDTDFAPYLFVLPERHHIDKEKKIRMYHNMHTGKWWWSTQEALTVFGNKTAYPVYMTIGNIPKEIRRTASRRGYILLGYLPTSRMKHVKNKAARRHALHFSFRDRSCYMLEPLKPAGITGLPMTSGDGVTRRGHPIYATFVGDYPEHLVTAVKTGECPTCEVPRDELGEASEYPLRDLEKILEALETLDSGPSVYAAACEEAGIKPIFHPFWEGLPYTNIFQAISPDVLHQLCQGICVGEAEIDVRCRRLPQNHNVRLFMSGISKLRWQPFNTNNALSRVTGKEHDQISRFLLALIIDVQLPNNISPAPLIAAVRGILDFNALQRFQDNKWVFVALEIREEFNLPKLHSCRHYVMYIKLFGRVPQMTLWLERKEKIYRHEKYIQWRLDGSHAPPTVATLPPGTVYERRLKMTNNPTLKAVRLTRLVTDYGAKFFRDALARYVVQLNYPTLSRAQVEARSRDLNFSFNSVPVFHRIKFTTVHRSRARGLHRRLYTRPTIKNGEVLPARFDTALINDGTGGMRGDAGEFHCILQLLTLNFSFIRHHLRHLFLPGVVPSKYLAYVEWFTLYPVHHSRARPLDVQGQSLSGGRRTTGKHRSGNIRRRVHLLPKFGPVAPAAWKSSTVLDQCPTFFVNFVNSMTDRHIIS